jgi:phosphoribosylformimino-5-aminoimidazole carboxamide ribotide isomerase
LRYLLVIPSIDVKNGKTVRVVQGIPELDCKEYGSDPVEMARIWRAENAKLLHVVDFDGAFEYSKKNISIINEICSSVIIPVEYTGGVRTMDDAERMFDLGVSRIAINTMAYENPNEFKRVFEKFGPEKIVISLDVLDNEMIVRGRKIKTGLNYLDYAKKLANTGIQRFIVTDVKRNGTMSGPNLELSARIAKVTNQKVTLSGGVRNKDELMDIQALMPLGVDSVIVGRALYENRFPCQKLWRVAEAGLFN